MPVRNLETRHLWISNLITAANTHCAYPWRDGQAELASASSLGTRQHGYECNRAQRDRERTYSRNNVVDGMDSIERRSQTDALQNTLSSTAQSLTDPL